MNRRWLAAGVLALALCGCSKDAGSGNTLVVDRGKVFDSKGSTTVPPTDNGTSSATGSKTSPTPNPPTGTTPPGTVSQSKKGSNNTRELPPDLDGKWKPDSEPPMELAKAVDQKVAGLKNMEARVTTFCQDNYGAGETKSAIAIQDGKVFHVEYPILLDQKENDMTSAMFIADGQVASLVGTAGPKSRQPVSSLKIDTKIPLAQWSYSFPQIMFTPICGGHPLEDLVAEAQKPGSNAKVSLEKVTFAVQGKTYTYQRLHIDRNTPGEAPISLAVKIDSDYHLPVTIEAKGGKTADKPVFVRWSAEWNFHPHLPLKSSFFTIPSSSSPAKKA